MDALALRSLWNFSPTSMNSAKEHCLKVTFHFFLNSSTSPYSNSTSRSKLANCLYFSKSASVTFLAAVSAMKFLISSLIRSSLLSLNFSKSIRVSSTCLHVSSEQIYLTTVPSGYIIAAKAHRITG